MLSDEDSVGSASTHSAIMPDFHATRNKNAKEYKEERRGHKVSLNTHISLFDNFGPTLGVTVKKTTPEDIDQYQDGDTEHFVPIDTEDQNMGLLADGTTVFDDSAKDNASPSPEQDLLYAENIL